MSNLYVRIFGVLALMAALTYAVMSAYQWAYNNGVVAERGVWTKAQNEELLATRAELESLQFDYAKLVTDNSDQYQKGLKDGQNKKTDAIKRVNNGTLVLRDKYAADCGKSEITSDPAPGRRDATPEPGLSRETSEFLIGLASEADDVVKQLTTCQADYQALFLTCSRR